MTLKNASGTVLRSQSYTIDNASQITGHTVAGVATTYGYDLAGQLTSESRSGYSASYTFDGNGNRLTRTVNGTTENYTYDDGDKLLNVKVGTTTVKSFGYDAAGRTRWFATSAGTTNLSYDFESRVTWISGPGFTSEGYAYNGLSARVSLTPSGGSTRWFQRDGATVTSPVLRDTSAVYTPGISERRGSTTTFQHSGLKSQDAQSTTSQTVAATKQYDAYGNVVSSSGTWQGPFGYGGAFGYQEDPTGLKLLGHRYYDSSTGRFLTRDPIKDGTNWYAYCDNDPIGSADPEGLNPFGDYVSGWGSWWSDIPGRIRDWWSGRDTEDNNGNPVRVGGWPAVINPEGNAITFEGTVHVSDEGTLGRYLDSPGWQDHEEGHIQQGMGFLKFPSYVFCFLLAADWEFRGFTGRSQHGPPGHDGNFWEVDAERYRLEKE